MAVSFPTFYGHHDENARDFMDSLEMAHLMAGRDQKEVKLRAFPLVLKGEARAWYDALAPPSKATWPTLYGAFLNKYGQGNTPKNLWKQLLRHRQGSLSDYNTYESKFTNLWERWAASLQGQGGAPNFLKRDKFVEGMFPTLKEKVEAKFPQTFEEAQEISTVKFKKLLYQERKSNCVKEREEVNVPQHTNNAQLRVASISADSHQEDLLHKLTQQLETLTLNLVQAPTRGQQPRDDARPLRRSTQELRCWNCNETGHGMYHCPHPRRPPPPPQPMATVPPVPEQPEERGVNIIKLEEPKELNVMPAIKRTRAQERDEEMKSDTSDEPKKGKKKAKEDEAESSKKKKSRQPRRVIGIDDFPLGKNLEPYDMVEDLKSQRPNITWPQLMHLSSSIRRQWPKLASTRIPKKRKEKVFKSIKSNTPKDIEPIVDAYIKGKRVSNVYVDGGAQMCVITERTMHRLGLNITEPSDCHTKLANNSKVKCLGIIKDVHITVLDVSAKVDFYVMPSKGEGYPLILGRPWLMEVNADQKWGSGKLILQKGKRIVSDMKLGKQSNICFETSTDEDSSGESSYGDEESYTSEESSMEVMGLVFQQPQAKGSSTEVEVTVQEEPMLEERFKNMLAKDLTKEEEEGYINMFKRYPHLFITDYSMIKGVDVIQHHIDLKLDAKPVKEKKITPKAQGKLDFSPQGELKDAYTLLLDRAYRRQRNKVAGGFVILNEEKKEVLKKGIQLHLAHSNNEAEYTTLKAGLEECKSMGIRRLMVKGDALLIVRQVQGTWACKNSKLLQWLHEVKLLMKDFEAIQIQHILHQHNKEADNMANSQFEVMVGAIKFKEPLFQGQETMEDILYFLEIGECPKHLERVQRHCLVRKALSYQLIGEHLYHKGKDLVLRRVPLVKEIEKILMTCHDGVCGGHFAQEITNKKILQAGFV
ncbi:hypothetical protein L7F22_066573 [Adiantum nelumboides]|nr:hypothetical protein [Adiantum nelumboides]